MLGQVKEVEVQVLFVLRSKVEENNLGPHSVEQNIPEHLLLLLLHAARHAPGYHADLEPYP